MKALTLWQPYAQAIALGFKKYETRSWLTKHRGPLAIHSSLKTLSKEAQALASRYGITDCPIGEIIVLADLTDCILMDNELIKQQSQTEIAFGDWRPGRYAWKLDNIRVLKQNIKISGKQGLWNWDETNEY